MRISGWSSDVCSSDLLKSVLDEAVVSRLADLKTASEEAVAAAQGATERLARQMLTIADITASVEARIAEVNTQVEEQNKEEFSRRSALLIESLNSTAIDIAKIMSNEVTKTPDRKSAVKGKSGEGRVELGAR